MKMTTLLLLMMITVIGCGTDEDTEADTVTDTNRGDDTDTGDDTNTGDSENGTDSGGDIRAEIDAYNDEIAQKAKDACGAPEDVEALDETSDIRLCYSEIVLLIDDDCSKNVFAMYPPEARSWMDCELTKTDATIACCMATPVDGHCTYAGASQCAAAQDTCPLPSTVTNRLQTCG